MEIAYGPLAYQNPEYPSDDVHPMARPEPPVPIGHGPFTAEGGEKRKRGGFARGEDWRLLEEQDDAYEYLLETLSQQQRDARLVLAQESPKQGLSQLVKALHRECRREQRSER